MARRTAKKASPASQEWNRGRVGEPAPPRAVPSMGACPTTGCGRRVGTDLTPTGWVMVQVIGSGPAREYCSGTCGSYGIALAEVRALRDPDGGEDR